MTATAPADRRLPRALRVAMAPLHWIERTRGYRRLGLLVLYLLVAATLAFFTWWVFSLSRLPDIGDPFDPAVIDEVIVPENQNAFTLYREASAALVRPGGQEFRVTTLKAWDEPDWSKVEPSVARWLEANREALELWRRGTERDRALLRDPRTMDLTTKTAEINDLHSLGQLAALEAARLRAEGDLDGAWGWYRAMLRASRHAGMGGPIFQRMIGMQLAKQAAAGIVAWMDEPGVDAERLRRALAEVREIAAMTAPDAQAVRAEYFLVMNTTDGDAVWKTTRAMREDLFRPFSAVPGAMEAILFVRREPERSRRVFRHLFAAWLDDLALPLGSRSGIVATTPGSSWPTFDLLRPTRPGVLPPAELAPWLATALFSRVLMPPIGPTQGIFSSDRREFGNLELVLAGRLYSIDHDEPPPDMLKLVGPYLDRLPDGYEGIDDLPETDPQPDEGEAPE